MRLPPPASLALLLAVTTAPAAVAAPKPVRCVALSDAAGDAGTPNDPGLDLRHVDFSASRGKLVVHWRLESAATFDPISPAGRMLELVFTVEGERFAVRLDLPAIGSPESTPRGEVRSDSDNQRLIQTVSIPALSASSVISDPAAYANRSFGATSRRVDEALAANCDR